MVELETSACSHWSFLHKSTMNKTMAVQDLRHGSSTAAGVDAAFSFAMLSPDLQGRRQWAQGFAKNKHPVLVSHSEWNIKVQWFVLGLTYIFQNLDFQALIYSVSDIWLQPGKEPMQQRPLRASQRADKKNRYSKYRMTKPDWSWMLDQTVVWLRMFSGKSVLGQSHSMVVQLLPQLAFNLRVWHLAFLAVKTKMRVSLLSLSFV